MWLKSNFGKLYVSDHSATVKEWLVVQVNLRLKVTSQSPSQNCQSGQS